MTTLLLSLLLIPTTALAQSADDLSLRDRAVLRAVERMGIGTNFGVRTNLIRLGNNVRTRRMSPRRVIPGTEGVVTEVIDGSVFIVQLENGDTDVVRTLGSEAPLLETGTDRQQCFALQAKDALSSLILGKTISLERDRNYQRDNKGRLLRYVRLNSLDVGGWMIWNGYAFSDNSNGHRRQTDYQSRQADAMENERGLWGHFCEYNPNLDTIEVEE